jgi:hypothetical protein
VDTVWGLKGGCRLRYVFCGGRSCHRGGGSEDASRPSRGLARLLESCERYLCDRPDFNLSNGVHLKRKPFCEETLSGHRQWI